MRTLLVLLATGSTWIGCKKGEDPTPALTETPPTSIIDSSASFLTCVIDSVYSIFQGPFSYATRSGVKFEDHTFEDGYFAIAVKDTDHQTGYFRILLDADSLLVNTTYTHFSEAPNDGSSYFSYWNKIEYHMPEDITYNFVEFSHVIDSLVIGTFKFRAVYSAYEPVLVTDGFFHILREE